MKLKCPACGQRELKLEEYTKRAISSHRDRAIYVCASCNHREVV